MGCVATIGVFDGVHRGHQSLVRATAHRAETLGMSSLGVTFDPNPLELLRPEIAPTRLCSVPRRVALLEGAGLDQVEVLRFDESLAAMSAEAFTTEILVDRLQVEQVVIGHGFRFGHRAAGTAETLRAAGIEVQEVNLLADAAEPVSSSRIRAAIAEGQVEVAADLLSRWHSLEGPVTRGHGRGREFGYPTANVAVDPRAAVPADGVYAAFARVGDVTRAAAVSIGSNPTFDATERTVEAFLLDFDANLYREVLEVEFVARLRDMVRFETVDLLLAQMAKDVERTGQVTAHAPRTPPRAR